LRKRTIFNLTLEIILTVPPDGMADRRGGKRLTGDNSILNPCTASREMADADGKDACRHGSREEGGCEMRAWAARIVDDIVRTETLLFRRWNSDPARSSWIRGFSLGVDHDC